MPGVGDAEDLGDAALAVDHQPMHTTQHVPHLVQVVLGRQADQLWAYPWTIAFLGVFIAYQLYRLSFQPSVGLTALTIFDTVIAWLTYREYHKQLAVAHR